MISDFQVLGIKHVTIRGKSVAITWTDNVTLYCQPSDITIDMPNGEEIDIAELVSRVIAK